MNSLKILSYGEFKYVADNGVTCYAGWPLFIIWQAWSRGCDFEDLATGFGPGQGTHGDWSGIRDSSNEAVEKMTERALNLLFQEEE